MNAMIKQAKAEIAKEQHGEQIEEIKNILRQIAILESQLKELRKQLSEF